MSHHTHTYLDDATPVSSRPAPAPFPVAFFSSHPMHGRERRPRGEPTREETLKVEKYTKAKVDVIRARQAHVYTPETYELTAALLVVNPDFYTVYNFRKEIILAFLAAAPERGPALWAAELALMEKSLQKNHKSYCAWAHRLWVCEQGGASLPAELELCARFLAVDERNFHCWNYRRSIAQMAVKRGETTVESEFDFTTTKIEANFSNYSAWHYRSVLLPLVIRRRIIAAAADNGGSADNAGADESAVEAAETAARAVVDAAFDAEVEMVTTAFAMEPDDQSSWLYYRWLIGQVLALGNGYLFPVATNAHANANAGAGAGNSAEASSGAVGMPTLSTLMPFLPNPKISVSSFTFLSGATATATTTSAKTGKTGAGRSELLCGPGEDAAPIESKLRLKYRDIATRVAAAVASKGQSGDDGEKSGEPETATETEAETEAATAPETAAESSSANSGFVSLYFQSTSELTSNSPSMSDNSNNNTNNSDSSRTASTAAAPPACLTTPEARAALVARKLARITAQTSLVASLLPMIGAESKWAPGMVAILLVTAQCLRAQARALALEDQPAVAEAEAEAEAAAAEAAEAMGVAGASADAYAAEGDDSKNDSGRLRVIKDVFARLIVIDPARTGYYQHVCAQLK